MSKNEQELLELTETEKKQKVVDLTMRLQEMCETLLSGNKVTLEAGKEWAYLPDKQKGDKLFFVPEHCYNLGDVEVMGYMLRKLADGKYTGQISVKGLPDRKIEFCNLLNAICEVNAQDRLMRSYVGTYKNLKHSFLHEDSEISQKVEGQVEDQYRFLLAIARQFWRKPTLNMTPTLQKALEDCDEHLYSCFFAKTTNEVYNTVLEKIWPIYEKMLPPQENGNGEGGGEGKAGGGQSQANQKLNQTMKNMSDLVDGSLEKMKESLKQATQEQAKELEQMPGEEHEDFQQYESVEQKEEKSFDDEIMEAAKKLESSHGYNPSNGTSGQKVPYEILYSSVYPYIGYFKKKLGSIMKDNLYNRQGGDYRTGKLNSKKLYRFKCKSDKLFTRKVHRLHKDYKVTILVDESGSMAGENKNRYAAEGCTLLAEVLHAAHIDFEIRGFNCSDRVYKRFGETFGWTHRRNIENIIPNTHTYDAGGNHDGYAVNLAHHHLIRGSNRSSERLLFVLSDGYPAEGGQLSDEKEKKRTKRTMYSEFDLKHEIAEASKDTHVVGIGINAKSVLEYYENSAVCDTVSELPSLLLSQIKKCIKRG